MININNVDKTEDRTCKLCNVEKNITLFSRKGLSHICLDCSNNKRRNKYENNETQRKKAITQSTIYKKNKKAIRDKAKQEELEKLEKEIGKDNKICKYCKKAKPKDRFRHNRLKCRDCERDEPIEKFKRNIRSRIYIALKGNKNANSKTYLGCTALEYIKWLTYVLPDFNISKLSSDVLHLDHVIPLSKFDLTNKDDIELAFNWRNTMPLSSEENLKKNNKILKPQVEQHYKNLLEYHTKNNLELPQEFIDLFATSPNCPEVP